MSWERAPAKGTVILVGIAFAIALLSAYLIYKTSRRVSCDSNPNHINCTKDSLHVYGDGVLLPGANPRTFVVLGEYGDYGKDNTHVYWIKESEEAPSPHQIAGADLKTFAPIPGAESLARDKNHVYWLGYLFLPVPDVDSATFVLKSGDCGPRCGYFAQDKNHIYKAVAGQIVVQ